MAIARAGGERRDVTKGGTVMTNTISERGSRVNMRGAAEDGVEDFTTRGGGGAAAATAAAMGEAGAVAAGGGEAARTKSTAGECVENVERDT